MTEPLLEVENLSIEYKTKNTNVQAVTNASFAVGTDEYTGVIGESGSGKSTIAKSIIGGLDPNGQITSGKIKYRGNEIQGFSEQKLNDEIRWTEISYIPQAAMDNLDPLLKISDQATNIAQSHKNWSNEKVLEKLQELFEIVGLPTSRIDDYPHQFSGGMKQRVIIALSLLLDPSLIIADEPTTALDVIMQDQVLEYLDQKREIMDISLLLITHDISVVFDICDSMIVMHGGQISETGSTIELFDNPRHPYTALLQNAFPDVRHPNRDLEIIEGEPPTQLNEIDHCTFADRCPWAKEECFTQEPPLQSVETNSTHATSCIRTDEIEALQPKQIKNE